jgi:hypothetical protein
VPRGIPAASKAVFINCPFDDQFKPVLRATVFAIISSGYYPRCALDVTDGADIRIDKIARMIGECDWGIHDLSRVEVVGGAPRFNMPMELGLHLGARVFGAGRHSRKRVLILDAKPHRYDATLSDISGQDIDVHNNQPNEAIRCVRNWLSAHRPPKMPPLPGAPAMQEDYRRFRKEIPVELKELRLPKISRLEHNDFRYFVDRWIVLRARKIADSRDSA